jgi:membrane protease YdiL (CAAX protease family)
MIAIAGVDTAWQTARLQQTDWLWYPYDYAGRLLILGLLALDPALRAAVFRRERLKVSLAVVINWGLALIPIMVLAQAFGAGIAAFLPDLRLGFYPEIHGPLYLFDMSFGLALVAVHEELCFRRAIPFALGKLGDGALSNLASAALFGAFHWWTGIANMFVAAVFGIVALKITRRSGAIWPVMVIHFLADAWYLS